MRSHCARSFPPRPRFKCRSRRAPYAPTVEIRRFKRGPQSHRAIRPECLTRRSLRGGGCAVPKVTAMCLFGCQTAGRSSPFSRLVPLRLARAGRRWGRAAGPPRSGFAGFTTRAPVTPSRYSIGMSCRLLCASFTGCGRNMPASAGLSAVASREGGKGGGGACEHVSFPLGPVLTGFRWLAWTLCYGVSRLQPMCPAIPAQKEELR